MLKSFVYQVIVLALIALSACTLVVNSCNISFFLRETTLGNPEKKWNSPAPTTNYLNLCFFLFFYSSLTVCVCFGLLVILYVVLVM